MTSIRVRLLWGVSVCLLFIFAVSGLFLYLYLHRELEESFDSALLERAKVLAKTTEQHDDGTLEFEFLEANLLEFWPQSGADYYQVWRGDGETVSRSPSLMGKDLPVSFPLKKSPIFKNSVLPDGRKGKIVFLNFYPHSPNIKPIDQCTMAIGMARTNLDKAQFRILKGLFLTGLTLVLSAFPAVWWSVRRALLSLDKIGEMANLVKADNLSFRFPIDKIPRELLPLCENANNILERLEAAFNRERRFTSDAAHEFRTPIAELRTIAEVGLEETKINAPIMKEYFLDALEVARNMEALVNALLTLTRCEAGIQKTNFMATNISDVFQYIWAGYQSSSVVKDLVVKCDIDADVFIMTDENLFRAMISNIFSNAVEYTPVGKEISLSLKNSDDCAIISVINSCHALSQEDVSHIFEPFWRKGKDKTDALHCGVGLPLVASYSKLLGMTITAAIPSEGFFQITLSCPTFHEKNGK